MCTEQEDCVMYNYDRLQQKCDLFSHAPLVYGVLPESTSKRVSHLRSKSFFVSKTIFQDNIQHTQVPLDGLPVH